MNQTVMPGNILANLPDTIKLGPGLSRNFANDKVICAESGILRVQNNYAYVQTAKKRYIPVKGDLVLGVVTHKHPEYYRVDINAPELATLSAMAFESATKRNRVTVNIGDLIYAKVSVALDDLEPELVCVNLRTGKSDGMGVINCPTYSCSTIINLQAARKALSNDCSFAKELGSRCSFEWCIGLNGRIWVSTSNPKTTSLIVRLIPMITFLDNEQIKNLVNHVCTKML